MFSTLRGLLFYIFCLVTYFSEISGAVGSKINKYYVSISLKSLSRM